MDQLKESQTFSIVCVPRYSIMTVKLNSVDLTIYFTK